MSGQGDAWDLATKDTTKGWCPTCKEWTTSLIHMRSGSWHSWIHGACGTEVVLVPKGLGEFKDELLVASVGDLVRQLNALRSGMERIAKIAADDDSWPGMIEEVRAIVREVA